MPQRRRRYALYAPKKDEICSIPQGNKSTPPHSTPTQQRIEKRQKMRMSIRNPSPTKGIVKMQRKKKRRQTVNLTGTEERRNKLTHLLSKRINMIPK